MKKINIFLLLFTILNLNCKSQSYLSNNITSIEISNFEYGKISLPYSEIDYLSKTFNVKKKYITTSIYYRNEEKIIGIPINDNTFNYIFFGDNTKQITKKATLYVKSYFYKGEKKYFAYKIE